MKYRGKQSVKIHIFFKDFDLLKIKSAIQSNDERSL